MEPSSTSSNVSTFKHDINALKIKQSSMRANQPTINDVLSSQIFCRYLLFNFLFIGSSFLPSVFIVDYGARWFAGCNPNSSDICNNIDYTKLNFYQSLSTSLKGGIAFFFAGFVGRLSDTYGRKGFLLLHPILFSLQILPLVISSNFLWYLLLTPCAGFVGASLGLSPMMSAYISDVLPPSQRTLGFAISYGSAGLALLSSAIISLMVSLYMNDYINFIIILLLYIGQTIYIWFFIPESLSDKHRKAISAQNIFNPLRPLLQIRNNRIVFWISVVQFLITFMEVGILNICMVYILTQLHITKNDDNYLIMFTFIISVSFGLFIATLVILPQSKKYPLDCIWAKTYKLNIIKYEDIDYNNYNNKHKLSEMSQLSNLSEISRITSINENHSININKLNTNNNKHSVDSINSITMTDDGAGTGIGIGAHVNSPITPQITSIKHKYFYHRKPLFAHHNINNNNDNQHLQPQMSIKSWIDYNNLLIGVFLSFISLLFICLVAWIHNIIYIAFCGIIVGSAVGISFPSANGVATNALRNDEQGKGFGIIYAVKGVTSAIAPFVFGTFYNYLVAHNAGPIIFIIGMILTLSALCVSIFPLRWVLCDQQGKKRKNCLIINEVISYT